MSVLSVAIFALVALASLGSAAPDANANGHRNSLPERKDKADVDTLELVQIMWRHGDRTPIVQYPKDPLQNETLWYPYATGFEAITKRGRQMHYDFGKYLRQRYDGFLSDVYSPKEIFVQSSDADRAIMSALSNMAGLWPPTPKDPKSQWNADLPWQAIPVHTIQKPLDNFINFGAPCPRFKELKEDSINNTPFAVSINSDPENVKLCKYVMEHTGLEECDFETISDVWDTLRIQKLYNMTLPAWVASVYDQMADIAPIFFDSRVTVHNEESKRVKAGPLLNFLVKNMDVRRNSPTLTPEEKSKAKKSKMFVLSGHDTTSSIALGAIGVFDTQFPAYASAAIFELHKATPNQAEGDQAGHVVRVFFRNDTSVPPFEFEVPQCGYPCKLDKFKELFSSIIETDGTKWQDACKSGGTDAKSDALSSKSSALLPTFLSLMMFAIAVQGSISKPT